MYRYIYIYRYIYYVDILPLSAALFEMLHYIQQTTRCLFNIGDISNLSNFNGLLKIRKIRNITYFK